MGAAVRMHGGAASERPDRLDPFERTGRHSDDGPRAEPRHYEHDPQTACQANAAP